jgi:hypothetical protein
VKQSQKEKIIALLLERFPKWATNVELNQICFRYGGRIDELREEGWAIENLRNWDFEGNVWSLWLESPTKQDFPYLPKYHKDCFEIRKAKIAEKVGKKLPSIGEIFEQKQVSLFS